ncbi:MAG: hypothetical protein IPG50_13655 [Myxococcales bacterium]|nr:hypothetical protein [Myxococcales bacterium]
MAIFALDVAHLHLCVGGVAISDDPFFASQDGGGGGGYDGGGYDGGGYDGGGYAGGGYDGGGYDGGGYDGGGYDGGGPSVEDLIQDMSPGERDRWPTEADVDTTGVEVRELSAQERFDQQVDLIQNYRDAASQPELVQGDIANCYAVAAINSVAQTPEGQAHLASLVTPLGNGVYNVTLQGVDGPTTVGVVLNDGEVFGSGPDFMMAIEKAIVYSNNADGLTGVLRDEGGNAGMALAQLGLNYVFAGDSPSPDAVAVAQVYGQDGHAYAVGGTLVDPAGNTVIVPLNPWGVDQIAPVSASSAYIYTATLDSGDGAPLDAGGP